MKSLIQAASLDLPPRAARIGVLFGGRSRERERSLLSGQAAIEALKRRGYERARLIDTADPDLIEKLRAFFQDSSDAGGFARLDRSM